MIQERLELSEDCGCAILACEDDLSQVSSNDCECADCLEAKIEACTAVLGPQSKATQEYHEGNKRRKHQTGGHDHTTHQKHAASRSTSNINGRHTYSGHDHQQERAQAHCHGRWAGRTNAHTKTASKPKEYKPIRKPQAAPPCSRFDREHFSMPDYKPDSPRIPEMPQLLPERIDVQPVKKDFNQAQMMLFVNRRIQENLLKHKHAKTQERLERLEVEERKKEQLDLLHKKARMLALQSAKPDQQEKKPEDKKPWNYTLKQPEIHPESCCHKIPLKPKVDTKNYNKEQLERQEFLKGIYSRIKEQMKAHRVSHRRRSQPCQFHEHADRNQSPKEIDNKIKENARKVMEQMAEESKRQINQEKKREAKLRGLAAEAKRKLSKAKKQSVSVRPEFRCDVDILVSNEPRPMQKENTQDQEQVNVPQVQSQQMRKKGLNATSQSSKYNTAAAGAKKTKKQNKTVEAEEARQLQSAETDPNGKFYVWDVPVRRDEIDEVFKPKKQPAKDTIKYRQEVEKEIQANQRRKLETKVAKTRQQQFEEKVEQKKNELLREFRGAGKQLEPSLTEVAKLRKDTLKR